MANFFKDYQKQVRETRAAAERAKREAERKPVYKVGQLVRINPAYDSNGTGKKYFADYSLCEDYLILADTKEEAKTGYGHIYSIYDVVNTR